MKTTFHAPLPAARTFLAPSDLRMIHDAAADHGGMAGAAVQLATLVPIRLGEIHAALIEDVDFYNGILCIPRLSGPDSQIALGEIGLQIVTATAAGRRSGILFGGGGRWDIRALRLSVERMMRSAGVPDDVVHAQCGRTAPPSRSSSERMLKAQTVAADTSAAALGLFTKPVSHRSSGGRLSPIDHIRAVRRLLGHVA